MTTAPDRYLVSFAEPTGYLNFASYGPPWRDVVSTIRRLAAEASVGTLPARLHSEDERALTVISRLSGVDRGGVALTGSTSLGFLQIAFGVPRGEVIVSSAEFPSNLYAWWRSAEAGLSKVRPSLPSTANRSLR